MSEAAQPPEPAPQTGQAPPPDLSWFGLLENYAFTLLGCAVLIFFGVQRGMFFIPIFFAVLLVPWLVYTLVRMALRPRERKWRLARVVLWSFSMLAVVVTHQAHARAARQYAETVLVQLQQYKLKHGAWPAKLEDVGFNSREKVPGKSVLYSGSDGGPYLSYRSTFNPFDRYSYDFNQGVWEFHPD